MCALNVGHICIGPTAFVFFLLLLVLPSIPPSHSFGGLERHHIIIYKKKKTRRKERQPKEPTNQEPNHQIDTDISSLYLLAYVLNAKNAAGDKQIVRRESDPPFILCSYCAYLALVFGVLCVPPAFKLRKLAMILAALPLLA
jgi:hypothetical protein